MIFPKIKYIKNVRFRKNKINRIKFQQRKAKEKVRKKNLNNL